MAIQSITKIYIKDTPIFAFEKLTLKQDLANHHHLEIVCRMDVLESIGGALSEESKNFLGNRISVIISSHDGFLDYGELEFQGIVTQIKSLKSTSNYAGDKIVIKAMSPTIAADDGPNNLSYLDSTISDIITRTFSKYHSSVLEVISKPTRDMSIHYSVQQNESSFKYAARLAAQYGQWYYYNGKELVFGKPEVEETKLRYKYDLIEYDLTLVPKPSNHLFFAHDYLLDEVHEKSTDKISAEVNGYSGFVSDKAQKLFVTQTQVLNNVFVDQNMKPRFEEGVTIQKKSIENNQVLLRGVSDNPGVKLGNIVCVDEGNFRVIKVTHTNNMNGDYSNHFEAVTAENTAYPLTNINAFPQSQSQIGIVKENNDPQAMGRVKVQFPWQKQAGATTPWIRIASVHAGSGKGFYSVPEQGEEVIVDFIGGNAESPYVLGCFYNKNAKPPGNSSSEGNDYTIFMTRSGCSFTFNDSTGSVTIVDKTESKIELDGEGNITLDAEANIYLLALDGEITIDSPTINIGVEGGLADNTNLHGQNIHIHAAQKLELISDLNLDTEAVNNKMSGTATIEVTGGSAKLNGTSLTEVKGGIVKVN